MTAAQIMRQRVRALEHRHAPGVNPFLTRTAWDTLVMAEAFMLLDERLRSAEEDQRRLNEIMGVSSTLLSKITANDILFAARDELARSYVGLPSMQEEEKP